MALVGTAINLGGGGGGGNENLSSSADVLDKTSNLGISLCCFADDGKEMDKYETRTTVYCVESCCFCWHSI